MMPMTTMWFQRSIQPFALELIHDLMKYVRKVSDGCMNMKCKGASLGMQPKKKWCMRIVTLTPWNWQMIWLRAKLVTLERFEKGERSRQARRSVFPAEGSFMRAHFL
jgi:hypothetical protein